MRLMTVTVTLLKTQNHFNLQSQTVSIFVSAIKSSHLEFQPVELTDVTWTNSAEVTLLPSNTRGGGPLCIFIVNFKFHPLKLC